MWNPAKSTGVVNLVAANSPAVRLQPVPERFRRRSSQPKGLNSHEVPALETALTLALLLAGARQPAFARDDHSALPPSPAPSDTSGNPPAQATPTGDHWEWATFVDGSITENITKQDGTTSQPESVTLNHAPLASQGPTHLSLTRELPIGAGGVGDFSENIKLTTTFKWTATLGAAPSSLKPPPATLYTLEAVYSFVSRPHDLFGVNCPWVHISSVQLSDGFSDPTNNYGGDAGGSSFGKHLTQHDAKSGTVTVTCLMSAACHIADDVLNYDTNYQNICGCDYGIAIDDRSAIITCPALENPANYHAGSPNDDVGSGAYYPGLNLRNSDGSMTVDTVVGREMAFSTLVPLTGGQS